MNVYVVIDYENTSYAFDYMRSQGHVLEVFRTREAAIELIELLYQSSIVALLQERHIKDSCSLALPITIGVIMHDGRVIRIEEMEVK